MKKKLLVTLLLLTMGISVMGCSTKNENSASKSNESTNVSKDADSDDKVDSASEDIALDESLFEYRELEDGGISVVYYGEDVETLVIPETIDGKTVEAIGYPDRGENESNAFINLSSLKKVVIPDTVKEIYSKCFINTKNIESVEFGQGIEIIGKGCFGQTAVKEVVFPASLKTVGSCFGMCENLESVTFEGAPEEFVTPFVYASDDLTIIGPAGSSVEAFATEQGYTFKAK